MSDLKKYVKSYPGFPKSGIVFRDFLPLVENGVAFHVMINKLTDFARKRHADVITGPEARAFLIGPAMAYDLNIGFVPARKKGKIPAQHISASYGLEYGESTLEMEKDAIKPGQRVVIVDDLIATGGTAAATANLVNQLGGRVAGIAFVMELKGLHGRKAIHKYVHNSDILSLIQY